MRRIPAFVLAWFRALLSAAFLLSAGLPSPRRRAYLRTFSREVGLFGRLDQRKLGLPARDLDALWRDLGPAEIVIADPVGVEGNVSVLELAVLARLVRAKQPVVIWEIGTFDGRTTRTLAANAPPGARVHTLDLPASASDATAYPLAGVERDFVEKAASGARFAGTPEAMRITQHLGDSARFDFGPWAGGVDFVFVDGSHAAAYVRNDTDRALAMTAGRNAVIVWHDYGEWPDVTRELDAFAPSLPGLTRISGTTLAILERRA